MNWNTTNDVKWTMLLGFQTVQAGGNEFTFRTWTPDQPEDFESIGYGNAVYFDQNNQIIRLIEPELYPGGFDEDDPEDIREYLISVQSLLDDREGSEVLVMWSGGVLTEMSDDYIDMIVQRHLQEG